MVNYLKYNQFFALSVFLFLLYFIMLKYFPMDNVQCYILYASFLSFILSVIYEFIIFISYKERNYAKILMITKECEHYLDMLGAEGKGLYEKAESLTDDKKFLDEVLYVAEARNAVVHNEKIQNFKQAYKAARRIKREIKKIYSKVLFRLWRFRLLFVFFILVNLFSVYMFYKYHGLGGLFVALSIAFFTFKLLKELYFRLFFLVTIGYIVLIYYYFKNTEEIREIIDYANMLLKEYNVI